MQYAFNPIFLDFEALHNHRNADIIDTFNTQILELWKIRNPKKKLADQNEEELIAQYLGGRNIQEIGVWVYYPWKNTLVHILPENEFIEVRTARNTYKITPAERAILSTKKVGIIGLSVGQTIAICMVLERAATHFKLADFDILELSNLNRINAGITDLGLPKSVILARKLYELDPFIQVEIYEDGLTAQNMHHFFCNNGNLDLIFEESDSASIKIEARKFAKKLGIPVVMDTSDRGMIDVERFDLESDRPIFHGLVPNLENLNLGQMEKNERNMVLLKIAGGEQISSKLKASMLELDYSIGTWPQLGSSVMYGGGIAADAGRRVLLGYPVESGRFYADPEMLVPEKVFSIDDVIPQAPTALSLQEIEQYIQQLHLPKSEKILPSDILEAILEDACLAPSGGNMQPWRWISQDGYLFLFLDPEKAWSFLDFRSFGSYLALGAASFNLKASAAHYGFEVEEQIIFNNTHLATYTFRKSEVKNEVLAGLASSIKERTTNRLQSGKHADTLLKVQDVVNKISLGAHDEIIIKSEEEDLKKIAEILGEIDLIRITNTWGHSDFCKEIRWTEEENVALRDGIDFETLGLSSSDQIGFALTKDYEAIKHQSSFNGGEIFKNQAIESVKHTDAYLLICANEWSEYQYFETGKLLEEIWLELTAANVAVQPWSGCTFLFARGFMEQEPYYKDSEINKIKHLNEQFNAVFHLKDDKMPMFLLRLHQADAPKKSLRKQLNKVFTTLEF